MHSSFLKSWLVACAAAVLAACGGGGGSGGGAAAPTPFASPAMFVPQGTDKITVALSCTSSPSATSAVLTINSDGDMTFSGVPGTATAVVDIVKVKYAEATYRYIDSGVGNNDASAYAELDKDDAYIYASWYNNGNGSYFYARANNASPTYYCTLPSGSASFSLKRELTEARLAGTMLKGVTQMSTDDLNSSSQGTYTGGVAYWDNHYTNNSSGNTDQDAIRYFSLNMSTGVMTGSPSPSVPPTPATNLRLALPTATTTYGYFSEEDDMGEKYFELQVEPSVGARIRIYFEVISNFFKPSSELYYYD